MLIREEAHKDIQQQCLSVPSPDIQGPDTKVTFSHQTPLARGHVDLYHHQGERQYSGALRLNGLILLPDCSRPGLMP